MVYFLNVNVAYTLKAAYFTTRLLMRLSCSGLYLIKMHQEVR